MLHELVQLHMKWCMGCSYWVGKELQTELTQSKNYTLWVGFWGHCTLIRDALFYWIWNRFLLGSKLKQYLYRSRNSLNKHNSRNHAEKLIQWKTMLSKCDLSGLTACQRHLPISGQGSHKQISHPKDQNNTMWRKLCLRHCENFMLIAQRHHVLISKAVDIYSVMLNSISDNPHRWCLAEKSPWRPHPCQLPPPWPRPRWRTQPSGWRAEAQSTLMLPSWRQSGLVPIILLFVFKDCCLTAPHWGAFSWIMEAIVAKKKSSHWFFLIATRRR